MLESAKRGLLIAISVGLSAATSGIAQEMAGLRGVLVSRTSHAPITDAVVSLGDSAPVNVRTDREGRFAWAPLRPGLTNVRARAIGYVPGEWTVTLTAAETLSVQIELEENPVPLPGMLVEGTRARANIQAPGFEARRTSGMGVFLTQAELRAKHATKLQDVMRDIPGVRQVCGAGRCTIRMTRARDCSPNFFVDGLPANNALPSDFSLDGVLGIEVYRTESETPAQFLRGMNVCGAIVIWTVRGR